MSGRAVPMHVPARQADSLSRFQDLISQAEALATDLDLDRIPEALGSLEQARVRLTFRAISTAPPADRLLGVEEAAELLGMADDTLYRKASTYPFTVREGRSIRFSRLGIEKYIRTRQGRG
jgi:predicted DNA-binding transcriptional regulator AlpA